MCSRNCSEDGIINFRVIASEGGGPGKPLQRRWSESVLNAERTF